MYFLRRLMLLPPLLLLISFLAFALMHIAPGGPFDRERTPASPEIERQIKSKYHLDEPFWKQYLRFLGDLAQVLQFAVSELHVESWHAPTVPPGYSPVNISRSEPLRPGT